MVEALCALFEIQVVRPDSGLAATPAKLATANGSAEVLVFSARPTGPCFGGCKNQVALASVRSGVCAIDFDVNTGNELANNGYRAFTLAMDGQDSFD